MTTRPLEHQIVFHCLRGKRVSPKKVPNWSEISSNVVIRRWRSVLFLNILYFTGWFYYLDFTTWRRLEAALLFAGIVELYPPWWWKSFVFFFSFHATQKNGFVVLRRQFSIDSGYIHTFRPPRLKSLFLWLSGKLWASGQRGRTKATTEKTLAWP